MMICRNCKKDLPDDSFGEIHRRGVTYKRKNCKPCHASIDYQNKLRKEAYNGNSTVRNCADCGKYFKAKYDLEYCIDCRNSDKRLTTLSVDVFNPIRLKKEYASNPAFLKHLFDNYKKEIESKLTKYRLHKSELEKAYYQSEKNYKDFIREFNG